MKFLVVKAVKSKKDNSVMAWLPDGTSVVWPGHYSNKPNKPNYRNKYVTVNCSKYQLEWVK